jgi:5-methylcytosine-specific restriction endonuclease McrA
LPAKKPTRLEDFLETQAAVKVSLPSKDAVEVQVSVKPPPTAVKSVRELILWEYAKVIAQAAKMDGNYRFIMNRYMKLKKGEIKWATPDRDAEEMMVRGERVCIYCGASGALTQDHIIPVSKGGPDIPANIVPACKTCNSSKQDRDIFEWYFLEKKANKIPRKVWSRYLKLVWEFHTFHRTIDRTDINQDGKLDIQDIGAIFKRRT